MNPTTLLILTLTILIFGISWPINKMGLEFMSPVGFAGMRLGIATVVMFVVVALSGNFIIPRKRDLPLIFSIGLLQMGAYVLFINMGLSYVSAGRTSILSYTTVLWVTPMAVFFFKERAGGWEWLGVLFGLLGVLVLFAPWEFDWRDSHALFGNLILLFAAFCWAIAILCARYMTWHHSALQLIPWQFLVAAIAVFLFFLWDFPSQFVVWNPTLVWTLLFTGVFATALGTWGIIEVSKVLPAMVTSLSVLAVPVCGIIFSAIILHETITLINILAIVLIFMGIFFTLLGQRHESRGK